MTHRYNLDRFKNEMRRYLTDHLGWDAAEADTFLCDDDHDRFKGDMLNGLTPKQCVDSALDLFREHGSEGDGAYQ